jgi:hypothetical protein
VTRPRARRRRWLSQRISKEAVSEERRAKGASPARTKRRAGARRPPSRAEWIPPRYQGRMRTAQAGRSCRSLLAAPHGERRTTLHQAVERRAWSIIVSTSCTKGRRPFLSTASGMYMTTPANALAVCRSRASPAEPAGSTPSSPGRNGQINKAITEASRCQLRGVQLLPEAYRRGILIERRWRMERHRITKRQRSHW